MTKKPHPTWLVPLGDDTTATVSIDDGFAVPAVLLEVPQGAIGGAARTLTPLAACQVGMALQEASAYAGQLGARRKR